MWRRLICVVCTVEAGVLAAILAALVIDPSLAAVPLTPGVRRVCALAALVLMLGSGYAAMCLLSDVASWAWDRITARSGAAADTIQASGRSTSRSTNWSRRRAPDGTGEQPSTSYGPSGSPTARSSCGAEFVRRRLTRSPRANMTPSSRTSLTIGRPATRHLPPTTYAGGVPRPRLNGAGYRGCTA